MASLANKVGVMTGGGTGQGGRCWCWYRHAVGAAGVQPISITATYAPSKAGGIPTITLFSASMVGMEEEPASDLFPST